MIPCALSLGVPEVADFVSFGSNYQRQIVTFRGFKNAQYTPVYMFTRPCDFESYTFCFQIIRFLPELKT
jgi:hypothetical protein